MQNKNKLINTQLQKNRHTYKIILTTLVFTSALIGCSTANRSNQRLSNIIEKEVTLLEKLKAERSQPEIKAAIQKDQVLVNSEAHLLMSLDELIEANKKSKNTFLKETNNKGEVNAN